MEPEQRMRKLHSEMGLAIDDLFGSMPARRPPARASSRPRPENLITSSMTWNDGNTSEMIGVPDTAWFLQTCHMLAVHPKMRDQKTATAMKEFGSKMEKHGRISEKQWDFFSNVYQDCMGREIEVPPKRGEPISNSEPEIDLDTVPF